MNNWQCCPKCDGTGYIFRGIQVTTSGNTSAICDVCKGKMIISSVTGLPPQYVTAEYQIPLAKIKEILMKQRQIGQYNNGYLFEGVPVAAIIELESFLNLDKVVKKIEEM